MLFRVSFWDDCNDQEIYGKTVEAKNENEAEDIFFDSLDEENDYSEDYPILVNKIEDECDDSKESDEEIDEDYERSWGPQGDEEDDECTIANIEIEIYAKDGKNFVYLSNDGSSGVKEEIKSIEDLKKIVSDYVEDAYYRYEEEMEVK